MELGSTAAIFAARKKCAAHNKNHSVTRCLYNSLVCPTSYLILTLTMADVIIKKIIRDKAADTIRAPPPAVPEAHATGKAFLLLHIA